MSFNFSQRLFRSLLFITLLIGLAGCGGKSGGTAVVVPDFDSGQISDGSFEFGSDKWFGNATNLQPEPGNEDNTINFADVAVAGQPFDVNLSQETPIIQGKRYTLSFRGRTTAIENAEFDGELAARTANSRTIIAGIGLNEAPFTNTGQEVTLTTEWQNFDLTLDAATFGSENSRVLFDMGADTGVVMLDDVILEEEGDIPAPPVVVDETGEGELLSNGDFEDGATFWTGNAANVTDELLGVNGSRANFANLDEPAANPFDVNLSQVIPILQGETYVLTFQGISNVDRSLIAGIGLNEEPWTNVSQTVDLTTEWQTYSLTLSAEDFGSTNSRVLFDMGAAAGQVILDEVSLKLLSVDEVPDDDSNNSNSSDDMVDYLYASNTNENPLDFKPDLDFSFGEWGSGSQLEGNFTGDTTYSPVFQVISGSGWGAPAAALAFYDFEAGFAQTYGCLTFKVKDLPVDQLFVKFTSGGQPETEIRIDSSNWVELSGEWKGVSVPMSGFPNTSSYTEFGIHTGYDNGGTILLTDIAFTDNDCADGTGSGSVISGVGSPTPPYVTPPNYNDGITYLFTSNQAANPWDLLPDTNYRFSDWGSGSLFDGSYFSDPTYKPVFEVKSGNAWSSGGDHNAVIAFYDFVPGFAENHGCLVFKVKDFPTSNVNIKFASPNSGPENEVSLLLADYSTDLTAGWKAISIPMSNFPDVASYDQFGIFSESTSNQSTFLITDIGLTDDVCSISPPPAGDVALPVDFEDSSLTYAFTDFDGGSAVVIANPQTSGNTSATVAQMVKDGGQPWGGSKLILDTPIDFTSGETFTMNVWSPRATPVLFKLEGASGNAEVTANHTGSGWEALSFDLTGQTAGLGVTKDVVLIFDLGVVGDATNNPGDWTFYFDDIAQGSVLPPPPAGDVALPVDFEDSSLTYAFTDFDGGSAVVIANPQTLGNTSATVAQMVKDGGQPWGGSKLILDTPIDFTSGETFTMNVCSPRVVPVLFKLEGASGNAEVSVTHSGSGWETLSFDLTGQTAGLGVTKDVVLIYDLGLVGDATNYPSDWTFYFDDIAQSLAPTPPPATTTSAIDFETSITGSSFTWSVFENFDNPALEVVNNPDTSGINNSAMVGKIITRAASNPGANPWAGAVSNDLPTFTLDASNKVIKVMVYKSVISDVGIKFESPDGLGGLASTGEIKVANTLINQWEELTFDFSGVLGHPANTGITGFVFFPDFDLGGRATDNVTYFDNISFNP